MHVMKPQSAIKTLTVRFPLTLHEAAAVAAGRSQKSLNAWIQEVIERHLRDEQERRLFDSFSRLGENAEECDVEFAWEAQREAIELVSP